MKPKSKSSSQGNIVVKYKYPKLNRFCFTKEELHKEYGLSLEGKLWRSLSKEDLPDSEWLTVFKTKCEKKSKLFLNMLRPEFIDDCRLLFQKVYQVAPPNSEITHKFARCFAYERCSAAQSDPQGHQIAWAAFGESVLQTCKTQPGGLQKKVDNWKKTNGPIMTDVEARSDKNEIDCEAGGSSRQLVDCMVHMEKVQGMAAKANMRVSEKKDALTRRKAQYLEKRDTMLRHEGTLHAAAVLQKDIESQRRQLEELKGNPNAYAEQIYVLEIQLDSSLRTLQLLRGDEDTLTIQEDIASLKKEIELLEFEVEEAIDHYQFVHNLSQQLKQGESLVLRPTFYEAPKNGDASVEIDGKCVACGEPLSAAHVVGIYMLACKDKYHPLCFASTCASRMFCVRRGCNEKIPDSAKSLLLGSLHNIVAKHEREAESECKMQQEPPTIKDSAVGFDPNARGHEDVSAPKATSAGSERCKNERPTPEKKAGVENAAVDSKEPHKEGAPVMEQAAKVDMEAALKPGNTGDGVLLNMIRSLIEERLQIKRQKV